LKQKKTKVALFSVDTDLPKVRVETVQENIENNSVNATELQEYCQKRFEFKTIKIKKFR
jgi:microprocessor complex subunit DGCR8